VTFGSIKYFELLTKDLVAQTTRAINRI